MMTRQEDPGFAGRPLKISTLGGNQIKPGRKAGAESTGLE